MLWGPSALCDDSSVARRWQVGRGRPGGRARTGAASRPRTRPCRRAGPSGARWSTAPGSRVVVGPVAVAVVDDLVGPQRTAEVPSHHQPVLGDLVGAAAQPAVVECDGHVPVAVAEPPFAGDDADRLLRPGVAGLQPPAVVGVAANARSAGGRRPPPRSGPPAGRGRGGGRHRGCASVGSGRDTTPGSSPVRRSRRRHGPGVVRHGSGCRSAAIACSASRTSRGRRGRARSRPPGSASPVRSSRPLEPARADRAGASSRCCSMSRGIPPSSPPPVVGTPHLQRQHR
jgi:hypothetical protein